MYTTGPISGFRREVFVKLRSLVLTFAAALPLLLSACAALDSTDFSAGSGPDADVQAEVSNRLRADAVTARANIGVSVSGGVVTLSGWTPDANVKLRAVSIAKGTPGATDVVDQLRR